MPSSPRGSTPTFPRMSTDAPAFTCEATSITLLILRETTHEEVHEHPQLRRLHMAAREDRVQFGTAPQPAGQDRTHEAFGGMMRHDHVGRHHQPRTCE